MIRENFNVCFVTFARGVISIAGSLFNPSLAITAGYFFNLSNQLEEAGFPTSPKSSITDDTVTIYRTHFNSNYAKNQNPCHPNNL